jgi:hypothetical protein
MQVIMLVNDKKFVNKSLNVSCNIWHSLGFVKTIDSGDNNVDVTRKNEYRSFVSREVILNCYLLLSN